MEKAYKFRLYPTAAQRIQMKKTFGCCRFVWNHYLDRRKKVFEKSGETLNYAKCSKELTALKKELPWLREADATALQSSLRALDTAFQNFFRRCKEGGNPGYPRFKSKHDHRQSYVSKNNAETIKVFDRRVQLPKLGLVKCRVSRKLEGRILSAAVEQTASGRYFVSFCCTDIRPEPLEKTGRSVGLDMGLTDFAVSSEGVRYENPKYLTRSLCRLARLQRQLSRKTKGSRRRDKARRLVARLHEHVRNQREDAQQKLSARLVRDFDVICLEDLAVKNMEKNRHLARAIADVSWSAFRRMLEYKCRTGGKKLVVIDRFYPSSQLCSACGYQNKQIKDLAVRSWTCPKCGQTHDRDINAAVNIKNEGLRLLA